MRIMTGANVLGIIPARHGSKGLPGKNVKLLCGKPLIAWAAEAAIASSTLSEVMCSTDSQEIAAIAEQVGLSVPFLRPGELAQDDSLIVDVLCHALGWFKEFGREFDYLCLVQPTSPFITARDINAAVKMAVEKDADTVITGYDCGQKHPSTMFTLGDKSEVNWITPTEKRMARRQDLKTVYIRSGLVYVCKADMILNKKTIYGEKMFVLEVPESRSMSIDTEFDFRIVEALMKMNQCE